MLLSHLSLGCWRSIGRWGFMAIFAALLAACQVGPQERTGDTAAYPTSDWTTVGGNYFNQRYSPLDQINRENVVKLRGVWMTHLEGSGVGPQYSNEAQPLVQNGIVYISTGANDVFAVSVETGKIRWRYRANLDPDVAEVICCGWASRGVALGDGKVFAGQLDGKLVALDQITGKIAWSVQAEDWRKGYPITSAPLFYEGLVITGFSGSARSSRGRLKAFDAKTGALAWTFYTVPGPGEPGH